MNFGKTMLASMLGTLITLIVLSSISFGVIFGLIGAATAEEEAFISPKTILHLDFNKPIAERTPNKPWFMTPGAQGEVAGLNDILTNIDKAKKDPNICGIYLNSESINASLPTIQQIRRALADFRASGKFIVSYANSYSQGAWYLATEAGLLALNPMGGLTFKGLNAELMFLKGTLEKLDVDVQIIRYGKFKAATEPLFLDKMSDENRTQLSRILTVMWDDVISGISERRGMEAATLNQLADKLTIQTAADACDHHLVDTLIYKDQLLETLKLQAGLDSTEKLAFVTFEKYRKVKPQHIAKSREQIAVVYATGTIVDGEGTEENTGGERISRTIRKARESKHVKAIVLRVNSGGGSALASEIIWREILLAAKEKPVIASFGDVAASGGYYISCAATRIMAEPTTITGSIGVWAAIPNLKGFMNDKLGITFDNVKTNENANFVTVMEPLTPYQRNVLQQDINFIYETFAHRVADGRNLTFAEVDSIGQGRIWSGLDALDIGLIDSVGGLTDAIGLAANLAGITEYRVTNLPEQKDPFTELIEELMGKSTPDVYLRSVLGDDYHYFEALQEVRELKGIQARLPVMVRIR